MGKQTIGIPRMIYGTQCLAAGAAVGAIFADGQITALRVAFAAVAVFAAVASVILAVRMVKDQARTEKKIELLVEDAGVPYTLEQGLSAQIIKVATSMGLRSQETRRFERLNCYFFESASASRLLLALRDQDLRALFLSDRDEATKSIVNWLRNGPPAAHVDEVAREVVFRAVGEGTVDAEDNVEPTHITSKKGSNGSVDYRFEFPKSGRPAFDISVNTSVWERKPFFVASAMAQLFDKVSVSVPALQQTRSVPPIPPPHTA
ncbi:MAG TPA: hypothetical protein VK727_03705 [Steroidobacteraceae bacterium]|nr:hypothetical protein [Steroidobacteraceae bacterium]